MQIATVSNQVNLHAKEVSMIFQASHLKKITLFLKKN